MKQCKAIDCISPVFAKGYCIRHQTLRLDKPANYQVKKRVPIKRISKALRDKVKDYALLRLDFLKEFPLCLAKLQCCTRIATDIHHRRGRGKFLLDIETWLPLCRPCHRWIEEHPKEAKKLGLSQTRLFDDVITTDNDNHRCEDGHYPPIQFNP